MAHFNEHCQDCERILGVRFEEVNKWMDADVSRFGPRHRFSRHHIEGANKAGELFGEGGRKAALIHILKDCGHIPTSEQWKNQEVDILGMNPKTNFNGYWDAKQFTEAARILLGMNEL